MLCSLEQEGDVVVLRGQIMSSKSGILWIYGAFKTTGISKKRLNHDLQVIALERGKSSEFTIQSWIKVQTYFSSRNIFVLNSLKSDLTVVLSAAQIVLH